MTQTTTEILSSANDLLATHAALIHSVRLSQRQHRRQLHALTCPPQELLKLPLIPTPPRTPSPSSDRGQPPAPKSPVPDRPDLVPAKRARVQQYHNYVPEEETIRNDYSQHYVDTGEWPQNWVLGAEPEHRFEEYPKQQRLLTLKKAAVSENALPPLYLAYAGLQSLHLTKFDIILLDPPYSSSFTWDHLQELPVPSLAADPSFVFLWVGSGAGDGLERGREVLAKWGYRRCEDVVWVKTNKTSNKGPGTDPPTTSLLTRTKQHCLIGIRGTVRRSTDSWFVHCNVDTDVIFWEGDPTDPTRKPPEMYTLIENFCLGFRRLEIFGRPSSLRHGWVTIMSPEQTERLAADAQGTVHVEIDGALTTAMRWVRETWEEGVKERMNGGKAVVQMTPEIDALRPKSPFRPGQAVGGGVAVGVPSGQAGVGGVAVGLVGRNIAPRFANGGRGGGPVGMVGAGAMGQGQMMVQSMMGMGMNSLGMGVGMGGGMDEMAMMGAWNPMMAGMGGMNVNVPGMGNMGNMAVPPGMNMGRMNTAATTPGGMGRMTGMSMMGPMGMVGSMGGFGGPAMGWGDQAQFGGMDSGWEGDGGMMNMGMGGMAPGMNMEIMNMGNGGMGLDQWSAGPGGF